METQESSEHLLNFMLVLVILLGRHVDPTR